MAAAKVEESQNPKNRVVSRTISAEQISQEQRWIPDVYVHSFVPESLTAINRSPATVIKTQELEGTNLGKYISSFAGSHFLTVLGPLQFPPVRSSSLGAVSPSNYGHFFGDALTSDREARIPEIRSYDLYGITLELRDHVQQVYSLIVHGIREGTPFVNLGDSIMLRQLVVDPATNLPRGMNAWLAPGGGSERSEQAPGFTGYELHAVVLGIDKAKEMLFIRAHGMIWTEHFVCNVSFAVPDRLIESLQRVVADVARELEPGDRESSWKSDYKGDLTYKYRSSTLHMPLALTQSARSSVNTWLERVLFPKGADSVLQHSLPSAMFPQQWFDQNLNYEQKKAIDAVQSRNYGNFCYLINGPPGTGKTKTLCEMAAQVGKDRDFFGSILLCAPSNPAADTLALRLRYYFDPKSLLRLNHFSRTFAEVPQELLPHCYVEDDLFSLPPMPTLMAFKIVVTTCQAADILIQARVTNRDLVQLQGELARTINPSSWQGSIPFHWTALLIDEAAQATEPETLLPLTVVAPPAASPNQPPVFVMAGDQHQLNPRTYSRATSLHISLFERLSEDPMYAFHPFARRNLYSKSHRFPIPRPPFVNLIRNYRSHPAILAVPSSLFYANTLIPEAAQTESLQSWLGWHGRRWPVLFACNAGIDKCEDIRGAGGGWFNVREARKAIAYSQDLMAETPIEDQSQICIMSPFQAQVNLLRRLARHSKLWGVNIGPMEAFQGLESRFVIVCTTRARKRFLEEDSLRGIGVVNEPKKFNVAITRAKQGLIVLGNPWVLATDPCWVAFMRFCSRNSLVALEDDKIAKTQGSEVANVNEWWSSLEGDRKDGNNSDKVTGLEAALLYKEREKEDGSKAAKRFMAGSESLEDTLWRIGLEAQETVDDFDSTTSHEHFSLE